jgi:NADP-dependent aldehyde dehydrogenase
MLALRILQSTRTKEHAVSTVVSVDRRTGRTEQVAVESSADDVDRLARQALAAAPALAALGRAGRADLLRACADGLESARAEIVPLADRESALGTARLEGELTRTTYQLRLFAEVLDEGSYLEAAVDHAAQTPMGPRPDLRRMLVPLGPVAVFGASNFPLAFSVPGGDTASALAAGCPVVVKAHGSHPATSQLCAQVLADALAAAGAPEGTLALVHGVQAGADLVAHPAVRAVGFTGSLGGGRALLEVISRRPDPIPFFGELASLNPVVVAPGAAAERAAAVGEQLAASFTLGAGQFCTKPGLVLVPAGADGDAVVAAMAGAVAARDAAVLLNEGIDASFAEGARALTETAGVSVLARGGPPDGGGSGSAAPLLLGTTTSSLPHEVLEECFGPVSVVVRYDDADDLLAAVDRMPSSLTATVHRSDADAALVPLLAARMQQHSGRLVFDDVPTGVAVSWAQHHGGPWPSTNSQHTSVGTTAIRRWLRPFAWQGAPADVLPAELRDGADPVPRRVDGLLRLPGAAGS